MSHAMRATWLVQRLLKPRTPRPDGKTHPLDKAHRVFGGGMLGLTKEMWDFVDPVFEIDYMGAAEYEFGTIPRVLKELIDAPELTAFSFVVERKDIAPNEWGRGYLARDKRGKKKAPAGPPMPTEPATLYVLCRTEHAVEAEARVRGLASDKLKVRDRPALERALDPLNDRDRRIAGWFELTNGFFFFTDEQMWREVCGWFGIEPAQAKSA